MFQVQFIDVWHIELRALKIRLGVYRRVSRMVGETKRILVGGNAMAEYFLGREEDEETVRLQTATSMISALSYMRQQRRLQ